GAGVEQPAVEKVRAHASGLERELAEAQGLAFDGELEEAALVILHGAKFYIIRWPSKQERAMRIVTLNVNGIRSAAKKGFFEWLRRQKADVVCLQEVKAQESDLLAAMRQHGFYSH